jgi:hypothetical protein
VERGELRRVAYLSELGATNEAALGGAGKGTPMLKIVEELEETKKEARSVLDELREAGRRTCSSFNRGGRGCNQSGRMSLFDAARRVQMPGRARDPVAAGLLLVFPSPGIPPRQRVKYDRRR